MSQEELRTIQCPACGAPLTAALPTRCPFCGTLVERAEAEKPTAQLYLPPRVTIRTTAARRGCLRPILIILAVLLIGGAALFLFLPVRGPGPSLPLRWSRIVQGAAIPVPVDRPGPPDLLVFTYDSSKSETYLSYLQGSPPAWKWDSPALSDGVYKKGIVIREGTVFLADKTTLLALDQDDGHVVWQATLSDSIISICNNCLRWVDGYVLALSQDGMLQAFEAPSGRPVWSRRLNETPRDMWIVNGRPAVLDYSRPNDVYSIGLQLYDPANGQVVQRFPGLCQHCEHKGSLSIYNASVIVDADNKALYFLFDLLPGYVQRWDSASGELAWEVQAEDYYLDRFNSPPLLVNGKIYASYNGQIIAVDGKSGELTLLADEQDYELTLQGEQDGILVALARRQRGSERYELWGLEATSGQVRWKYIPQDEEPIESAGGWAADKGFAWHLTRDGLAVLHVLAEPPTLVVGTIDLHSGRETALASSSLDDDYWAGLTWSDGTAWLTIRKVYAIDLQSGKVLYAWP